MKLLLRHTCLLESEQPGWVRGVRSLEKTLLGPFSRCFSCWMITSLASSLGEDTSDWRGEGLRKEPPASGGDTKAEPEGSFLERTESNQWCLYAV